VLIKENTMSDNNDFAANLESHVPSGIVEPIKSAAGKAAGFDPIELAHRAGVRSRHAYVGGFASIILALVTWSISRGGTSDSKSQSDRWGIFIGHWAPTFFAVGLALKTKEDD
jgi:hypothetical protein